MTTGNQPQAILIVSQHISRSTIRQYQKLKAAASAWADVYILFHSNSNNTPAVPDGVMVEPFTNSVLRELGYNPIRTKLVPGSNHFPVLKFFLAHPRYQYYWCIEDDVAFSGNWDTFFARVADAGDYDFISSHIRRYTDLPDWFWWDTYRVPGEDYSPQSMINSFNPVYRISNRALGYVDQKLKQGCRGHHEVLLPTMLQRGGFTIADLGSAENQVTPHLSLCTLATMRWKPVFFAVGNNKNKLYHPVKAKIGLKQIMEYITRTIKNKKEYLT